MKMRVWIRPLSVGSIVSFLDLASGDPLEPVVRGSERSDALAEPVLGQVRLDLLGGDLQPEEGVDAREVAAQRGGSGGVHDAVARAGAAELEGALDVEPAHRVAPGTAVLEQVLEQPVLGDVGLE